MTKCLQMSESMIEFFNAFTLRERGSLTPFVQRIMAYGK